MMDDLAFLYVEDDMLSRQVMRTIVTRVMGYQNLYVFDDSERFHERLVSLPLMPKIIFLDIQIRPIDGFAMLKIIRSERLCENAKVVALTASVMNEEVEKLKQVGFDGAVSKPLSFSTFPTLIPRILAGESIWQIT